MKEEVIYIPPNNLRRTRNTKIITRTTNPRSINKMRKYYQAALIIIATVSVVSLLFYRHEYNRLRYVLQVLNFFGKPGQKAVDTNCTEKYLAVIRPNLKFNSPIPSWQRLNDDFYVYSAYNVNKGEVRAIGFGRVENDLNFDCNVFFEDEIKATAGKFSYTTMRSTAVKSNILEGSKYRGYDLICKYSEYNVPVGVSFFDKDERSFSDAPILTIKKLSEGLIDNSSVICVAPPVAKPMSRADMISFLNFHELIGIENFIIYDFGISTVFHDALNEIIENSSLRQKFTYTVLPWNFPFAGIHYSIVKDVIETDCLYRTYNKIMYVTTLSWEEYIVMKYHRLITELLADLNKIKLQRVSRYKLETLTFCTQQKDDKLATNSTLVVLRKTRANKNIVGYPLYIYVPHRTLNVDIINEQEAKTNLVVANRYQFCDITNGNLNAGFYDPSILRFTGNILNAPIYKEFVTGNMFLFN